MMSCDVWGLTMSRGLGWMQREVLATLDAAEAAPLRYDRGRAMPPAGMPGRVVLQGEEVDLPDGVYDLRASVQFLARRHGQASGRPQGRSPYAAPARIHEDFRISFYRAARSLIRRGHLQWCSHRGQVLRSSPAKGEEGRFVCRVESGKDASAHQDGGAVGE